MNRAALNKATAHHYNTKHNRRKATLSAIAKVRCAQFKKDPAAQHQLGDGRAKWKLKAVKNREQPRSKMIGCPMGIAWLLLT